MKRRILSLAAAVCIVCLLAMTSCSAANPSKGKADAAEKTPPSPEQLTQIFSAESGGGGFARITGVTASGVQLLLSNEQGGTCIAAVYSEQGRLLSAGMAKAAANAGSVVIPLPAFEIPERCTVKAILTDNAYQPLSAAVTRTFPEPAAGGRTLVAYFSATNTTRPLAEYSADVLGADIYEIVPEIPYTETDLKYYTDCRADREQNAPSARPAISGGVENMEDYDVIFLGYPIWHGQAPRIISTFLERYDLTGKTIVPFCTSHSSGIGSSDTNLHALAAGANWLEGRRFAGGTSRETLEEWIDSLELPEKEASAVGKAVFNLETKRVTLNSGYTMPINGLGTYSLHGDECVNAVKSAIEQGVRLIDTARAYGNEEEIGRAIREEIAAGTVTREELFVITKIYPGSDMADPETSIQGCLDRLNIGYVDMMLLHHPDPNDVKAYKAMEKFVEDGRIRSLGLSNWYVEELKSFLPQVSVTPALVQNEIHPYYQENEVIPYIQDLGIVVQGWYPLGGRGHAGELLGDEVISGIAKAHGVSSAQVILRWNLQKGVVVIPGSSNPGHIKENTELYHFQLTADEMAQINALDRNEKHDWY